MALCHFCDKVLPEAGNNKVIIWSGRIFEGPACISCGKFHKLKIVKLEDRDG